MREIKFRCWDIGKKVFIPNDVYAIITTDFKAFGVMLKDWEDYREGEYFYKDSQVVMQYTGLTDKNGKEIYEGDIVESKEGVFTIENWGDGVYRVVSDGLTWDWLHQLKSKGYLEFGKGNYEVIGNIYATPELLTKQ